MIIPAILEQSFSELEEKIHLIQDVAETIEIDFIDNTSTEGLTCLDIKKFKEIETKSDLIIHFQVLNPLKYMKSSINILPFKSSKITHVSTIITQLTNLQDSMIFLKYCKKFGYKVGISLDPYKDTQLLGDEIKDLDIVQFMSVIPGKQGGEFIPSALDNISRFKKNFPGVTTHIDGGVSMNNLEQVIKSGVDNIVVGSAIFNTSNPKESFLELSTIFNKGAAHGTSK